MRLIAAPTTYSDDRGFYRVSSLVPGEYLVAVPAMVTTLPTSSVDEYLQALNSGNPDQLFEARAASGAPMSVGGGTRIGNYQIQSSGQRQPTIPPPGDNGQLSVYRTTFHPSSSTSAEAIALYGGIR